MPVADRYSRMVVWLKVAMPLAALAILSTLFFVAETLDPEAAIPYATVDVERLLKEQGITRPTFGGVTQDGVRISISASSVRPDQDASERLTGSELNADLRWDDGNHIKIVSPIGIVDGQTQEIVLDGGANLESSTGYSVSTQTIRASIEEASVIAENEVRAVGPAGDITAGQMELTRQTNADGAYLLVFKGGVRLLYQPQP